MYRSVSEAGAEEGGRAAPFDELPEKARLACLREVATTALLRYGIDAPPPELINLSENATYRIDGPQGPCFALRVHRDGYHSRAAIESELAWLTALRTDGVVTTPVPVPGTDGALVQLVGHPALPRPRHVVLFRWERGAEPPADTLGDKFRALGEIAARTHQHTRGWTRPAGFERHTWDFATTLGRSPHWGQWENGIGLEPATRALFARTVDVIGSRLARFGKTPDRFGLIHADMRLANLLVDGDDIKLLDFDDCGFGWHLYDAATAVSFFEHEPHVPELLAAWVEGYRREGALSRAEEAEIPTFVMLRRLLLIAWIGSHAETDLARSLGATYTEGAAPMCEAWLTGFG